jgi:hypothetical protein
MLMKKQPAAQRSVGAGVATGAAMTGGRVTISSLFSQHGLNVCCLAEFEFCFVCSNVRKIAP